MQPRNSRIRPLAVVVAALPYLLLGYPWYAAFRDSRSVAYFLITARHPAIGLITMGAILGAWHPRPSAPTPPRP